MKQEESKFKYTDSEKITTDVLKELSIKENINLEIAYQLKRIADYMGMDKR